MDGSFSGFSPYINKSVKTALFTQTFFYFFYKRKGSKISNYSSGSAWHPSIRRNFPGDCFFRHRLVHFIVALFNAPLGSALDFFRLGKYCGLGVLKDTPGL
jgi:hypothetical protein